MTTRSTTTCRRPGVKATLIAAAGALALLTLTACTGGAGGVSASGSDATGADTATATATATPAASTPAAAAGTGSTAPAGATTEAGTTATASAGPSCDHKMPISPDEIAVLRYTPEGGSLSLIFKYGNWGCPSPDSDGVPFVTVGKETYLPLDQAAYVTATNPIVESSENQHIGVQELLDWLEAHPDSGLVFRYTQGADGAINRLEEEYTP